MSSLLARVGKNNNENAKSFWTQWISFRILYQCFFLFVPDTPVVGVTLSAGAWIRLNLNAIWNTRADYHISHLQMKGKIGMYAREAYRCSSTCRAMPLTLIVRVPNLTAPTTPFHAIWIIKKEITYTHRTHGLFSRMYSIRRTSNTLPLLPFQCCEWQEQLSRCKCDADEETQRRKYKNVITRDAKNWMPAIQIEKYYSMFNLKP